MGTLDPNYVAGSESILCNSDIIDATGEIMTRLGAPAGASIAADIANIQIDNQAIADAVWDEDLSGHQTVDTTGAALSEAASGGGGGGSVADTDLNGTIAEDDTLEGTINDADSLG